ncbi:MAG: hypothetical protein H7Y22_13395 [Gemmatimonadaceae bacterium]|nr:hypothetical protein [Gloeobacterales cyanobacterium ES-bin-141]
MLDDEPPVGLLIVLLEPGLIMVPLDGLPMAPLEFGLLMLPLLDPGLIMLPLEFGLLVLGPLLVPVGGSVIRVLLGRLWDSGSPVVVPLEAGLPIMEPGLPIMEPGLLIVEPGFMLPSDIEPSALGVEDEGVASVRVSEERGPLLSLLGLERGLVGSVVVVL